MKKEWNEASIIELDLKETEYGGINPQNPDGYFMTTTENGVTILWGAHGS